tara:strand:+ start:3094 stop:5070 length:1977 start_codon:yes stop_codon:yes gene_type:complete
MAQAVKQKEVKYLNKDFNQFKESLIEHAKTYFPNSYNDFNEASPGMMFIEMAAYVGDVLSYYVDNQFKESLLAYAEETKSVYQIAQAMGYKPRLVSAANASVDVFQTVPAIGSGTDNRPDLRFGQVLKAGSEFSSTSGIKFYSTEDVSFQYTSSASPMTISVYESSAGSPVSYLLKKPVTAMSGTQKSEQFVFNNAKRYDKIRLSQTGITEIVSCTDSDGNSWYEVPFLAQDTVFIESNNTADLSPQDSQFADKAPYLLKLKKTSRRFTTYITTEGFTELRFGAGNSTNPDEEIIPNPDNVGSSLPSGIASIDRTFDPSNFLNTKAYGLAPANTTLTIVYRYGGGLTHNVQATSINKVTNALFGPPAAPNLSSQIINSVQSSIACSNELPAAGGRGQESVLEVKENALAYFQAQGRTITKEDYMMRVYTMPSRFGSVAKVYIVQDEQIQAGKDLDPNTGGKAGKNLPTANTRVANPLALNMYVLGYTQTKKLTTLNSVVKRNLATYLSEYRPVTDAVNIKDAYIINIGIRFSIVARVGYNKQEVLLRCIDAVKLFFAPDKWQINQPIVTQDLIQDIALVDGVASVVPPVEDNPEKSQILVFNRYEKGSGYSGNIFDLDSATKDGVIYTSLDPSIFELKFPSKDIEANCVGDSSSGAGY